MTISQIKRLEHRSIFDEFTTSDILVWSSLIFEDPPRSTHAQSVFKPHGKVRKPEPFKIILYFLLPLKSAYVIIFVTLKMYRKALNAFIWNCFRFFLRRHNFQLRIIYFALIWNFRFEKRQKDGAFCSNIFKR